MTQYKNYKLFNKGKKIENDPNRSPFHIYSLKMKVEPEYKNLFSKLWNLRPSNDQYMKLYGKNIKLPRRILNYSINNSTYGGFLGSDNLQNSKPPKFLLDFLNHYSYTWNLYFHDRFEWNNIYINFYDGGEDYIGYHKDSTKNFKNSNKYYIHTFNIYENPKKQKKTRTLRFKHNQTKENLNIDLSHFQLISFNEYINENYKHTVPKSKKTDDKRISITLRFLK
tara:strand:+ start:502 stop:1173 length:672 start_codon:yes stop_codon:yes gene_type:complete